MSDKQTFKLKVNLSDVPKSDRPQVLSDIADYLLEAALDDIGEGRSPVYGSKWPALSKVYKKHKLEEGSKPIANLELSGDLLDALEAKVTGKSAITYGITDSSQTAKADGHNNLSGDSKLPLRRFVPGPGETFRSGIMNQIQQIIDAAAGDEEDDE